jgi:hypothetical protein
MDSLIKLEPAQVLSAAAAAAPAPAPAAVAASDKGTKKREKWHNTDLLPRADSRKRLYAVSPLHRMRLVRRGLYGEPVAVFHNRGAEADSIADEIAQWCMAPATAELVRMGVATSVPVGGYSGENAIHAPRNRWGIEQTTGDCVIPPRVVTDTVFWDEVIRMLKSSGE